MGGRAFFEVPGDSIAVRCRSCFSSSAANCCISCGRSTFAAIAASWSKSIFLNSAIACFIFENVWPITVLLSYSLFNKIQPPGLTTGLHGLVPGKTVEHCSRFFFILLLRHQAYFQCLRCLIKIHPFLYRGISLAFYDQLAIILCIAIGNR